MACLLNLLAISVVICRFVKRTAAQGAQVQQVDNAEQFALLCRIYNVAKNPPNDHVDLQDPFKIVEEIDAINASIAEEKTLNETEESDNSSETTLKPTTAREAAVAQAILRSITDKAHNILDEIKKINATRDIDKVKGEFNQVIFGEGMNESHLSNEGLKDVGERGAACGSSGLSHKGSHAGENLVVDFFCLCAMRTDNTKEGIKEVCGVEVGGSKQNGNHGWGTSGPSGSLSMWASIKKGCVRLVHQHPKSTEEAYEVLGDFLKHLETGGVYRWGPTSKAEGSNRKPGMLGTGVAENGVRGNGLICDGRKGERNSKSVKAAGICVYYGPPSQWEDILWFKKLKTALNTVEALNSQTATIQRNIQKLQMLLHRAEKIYETTKVISTMQNPVVPPNLQTVAKRLIAHNAAWRIQLYHLLVP